MRNNVHSIIAFGLGNLGFLYSPMMKKANMDADTSISIPNTPDIIDSSMFWETWGILIAPKIPIEMYSSDDIAVEV